MEGLLGIAVAECVSAEKFLAEKKKINGDRKDRINPDRTWSQ